MAGHEELIALGEQLLRVQNRRARQHESALLDISAFRILWRLAGDRPLTMRELADELGLEQSTIHRQVHAAIAAGWIERFEAEGRAGKLLRPTAAGHAAYEHDGRIRGEAIQRALQTLGRERTATLTELLREFNDALDDANRT